jgi:PTH2 family peptidyl-tRNA hydrolase
MVEEVKMVIAVRKDIDIGKGKMAAQVAHAAVACALRSRKASRSTFNEWMDQGQKKIVIRVQNEEELRKLKMILDQAGIMNEMITDAGLTQVPPGTVTCLGIGPVKASVIDPITGDYPLY